MSHIPFGVTVTLTSDLVLRFFCVQSISHIFFEVGKPYFGVNMHLWMVESHILFLATVTLTSDLVLIIIVSGAYLLYYLRRESQIWCVNASWDG